MARHSRPFGWRRKQPWEPDHAPEHGLDPARPTSGIPQQDGPPMAVRTAWELRFGPQPSGAALRTACEPGFEPQPSGAAELRRQALRLLGKAAFLVAAGGWFGLRAWQSADAEARAALAVVWVMALAVGGWYGRRQHRAILADPGGFLARSRREAKMARRAVGTRSSAGVSVRSFLVASVAIAGMCVPVFLDPSVNPVGVAWSTCCVFFVPVLLMQARAFQRCGSRGGEPATGSAAGGPTPDGTGPVRSADPDRPVSLAKPESLS
ncbi:MAG: hypothetical protein JO144_16820 [Actinobacteria bacterium]|nr:hypothetical protein [Actinomycetota bacterium]